MENILVIYNPIAGKDSTRPSKLAIERCFSPDEYKIDIYETKCTGDAIKAVKEKAEGYDKIVACGGDGTLNETVNGLLSAGIRMPVGYIPMGTTNDFATTLGIPSDYREAIKVITEGHTNNYDVGLFNDRYFNYVGCFGPGSFVSYATPQKFKNKLGYPAYVTNGFLNAFNVMKELKITPVKIEYDGNVYEGGAHFCAISNSTSVAGMFKFGKQKIILNDGKFELLIVKKFNALKALPLLLSVMKGNYQDESIVFVKAENIKISVQNPQPWTLDGEVGGSPAEVEFAVQKKAIEIYSPASPMFE